MSTRPDSNNGVTPVLRLVDQMQHELDVERGQLAQLIQVAKGEAGLGHPPHAGAAAEALACIDQQAEALAVRQRAVLGLVDGALARVQAAGEALEPDCWAPVWQPPETAAPESESAEPSSTRLIKGLPRQRLARVLMVLGALLIAAALLIVVLGGR